MRTSIKNRVLKLVLHLGLAFLLIPAAMAQHPPSLIQDQTIMNAIDPINWQPGGKNFGFGSSRGTVTNQNGSITPQMVGSVRVGSFSVQNAKLNGVLSYDTVFSNHGHESHAPFDEQMTRKDSAKNSRNDGSQVGYSLTWTATMIHPADGYDGPQGGGYPSPAGARDQYSYNIDGVAVGTYFVPEWSMDTPYKPNIDNRNQAYINALEASQDRNSAKLDKAFNNPDRDLEWYHRVLYGFNGTVGLMASPVIGLGGYMQPEYEQFNQVGHNFDTGTIKQLQKLSVDNQYMLINGMTTVSWAQDNAAQWVAERPMIGESLEAGSWLTVAYQATKPGFNSLIKDKTITNEILDNPRVGNGEKGQGSGNKVDQIPNKVVMNIDGQKISVNYPADKNKPFATQEFPSIPKAHGFSDIVDNYASYATKTKLNAGATLHQLEGSLNGVSGRFEWIIDPKLGGVSHRMFVPNGKINGVPSKP